MIYLLFPLLTQQLLHAFHVSGSHDLILAEATSPPRRLVFQQVAFVSLFAHQLSGACNTNPLFSPRMGFILWHIISPLS